MNEQKMVLSILFVIVGIIVIVNALFIPKKNGVERESFLQYVLLSLIGLLSVPFDYREPTPYEGLLFFCLFLLVGYFSIKTFFRLPKITVYKSSWLDVVKVVTIVLERLEIPFEGKAKKSAILEKNSYHFQLVDHGNATIVVTCKGSMDPESDNNDVSVELKKYRKLPSSKYVHNQLVQALMLYRKGQKFKGRVLLHVSSGVFSLIMASLLFYL
ncbi:hypothetical protein [Halalkalibacter urbisdiaboli]|uniref:hypothetical protein n=1 Tax=Halalkalibacter urbisdiaboli TaxID=1960589 RepID=UPI000B452A7C|nr:hypothetical protein [Halalkalibacter urbisdiaboli]